MKQILMWTLVLAAILPPVVVGATAFAWRPSLRRPGLFVGIGLAAVYLLAAWLMFRQFPSHAAIEPTSDGEAFRQARDMWLMRQSILAFAELLAGSAVILWLLRRVL